jgi:hypothetical protein
MSTNQPGWEGTFLAFAIIFTVLIGLWYTVSIYYRVPLPWFGILVGSLLAALILRYIRRRSGP